MQRMETRSRSIKTSVKPNEDDSEEERKLISAKLRATFKAILHRKFKTKKPLLKEAKKLSGKNGVAKGRKRKLVKDQEITTVDTSDADLTICSVEEDPTNEREKRKLCVMVTNRRVDDKMPKLSSCVKDFMKLWNKHRIETGGHYPVKQVHLKEACAEFCRQYQKELSDRYMYHQCIIHFTNMYKSKLLSVKDFKGLLGTLNSIVLNHENGRLVKK